MAKAETEATAKIRAAANGAELEAALAELGAEIGGRPAPTDAALAAVGELAGALLEVRGALRSATRAREVLLASVAHDLRNPLNTFAMSTGLLRDDLESGELDRTRALALLARMERASHRMQGLIDELVEASRVEAGAIDLTRKPESAADVVAAALAMAKPLAAEKSATLEAGPVADVVVVCDRRRTAEALTKLVAVGLKLTGDGATLEIGAEAIEGAAALTLRARAPRATTSVPVSVGEDSKGGLSLLVARGLLQGQGALVRVQETVDGPRTVISFPAT